MPDEYPDTLLKGIPNDEYILGKSVYYTLFMTTNSSVYNPGWGESSINWEFDKGAEKNLLSQTKENGEIHFKAGAVRIPKIELDRIIDQYKVEEQFSYEKREVNNNKYHGNLLFINSIEKPLKATICGALSRAAVRTNQQSLADQDLKSYNK